MNVSFSIDCRGGGKESNMNLLPYMMRLLVHQVSLSPTKGLEELNGLLSRLSGEDELWGDKESSFSPVLPAALVLSLVSWSNKKWSAARRNVLIAAVRHAKKYGCTHISTYATNDSAAVWDDFGASERFNRLKPMLIYVGLVNKLYEWFKPARRELGIAVNISKPGAHSSPPTDALEVDTLSGRLCDISAMIASAKDVLEWLDEAHDSNDDQELLDVMECLPAAMCPTVDEFLTRALASNP